MISIDKGVFARFPNLSVGIVIGKGLDNKGKDKEVETLLSEIEELIKNEYVLETVANQQNISTWRIAMDNTVKSPIESLMVHLLENGSIKRGLKAVDVCHYISLKHMVPLSADDLGEIIGHLSMSVAKGDETYIAKDRKAKTNAGDIIYQDQVEVISKNWQKCFKTIVKERTKDIICRIEALPPMTAEDVAKIALELADMLEAACGGKYKTAVLTRKSAKF